MVDCSESRGRSIYRIQQIKGDLEMRNITIQSNQIFKNNPPSFSWRRDLTGAKLAAWHNLWPRIADLVLTQE